MNRQNHVTHSLVALLVSAPLFLSGCGSAPFSNVERDPAATQGRWTPVACQSEKVSDREACLLAEKQKLEVLGAYMRYVRLRYGKEMIGTEFLKGALTPGDAPPKNGAWAAVSKLGLGLLASGGTQILGALAWESATSGPSSQGTTFSLFGGAGWKNYESGGGVFRGFESVQSSNEKSAQFGARQVGTGMLDIREVAMMQASASLCLGGSSVAAYSIMGEGYSKETSVQVRAKLDKRLENVANTIVTGLGLPEARRPAIRGAIVDDFVKSFGEDLKTFAAKQKKNTSYLSDAELKKVIENFSYKTNVIELLHEKNLITEMEYRGFLLVSKTLTAEQKALRKETIPHYSAIAYLDVLEQEIRNIDENSKDVQDLERDVQEMKKLFLLN